MAAQQHKERGNALYAAGNYDEAIAAFTCAIEAADKGEKDLLKTTLSNRSAAHLQLKNVEAALADATKCTTLDPQWAKGHVRKGDALQVLDGCFTCCGAHYTFSFSPPTPNTCFSDS